MRIQLRSSKQLRLGFVALAVAGLLLPGLRAYAQTPDSGGEPGEDARPEKPDKPAKAAVPAAPAEPVETTFAEPPVAEAGPYVPFEPPPVPLRIENSSASIQFGILAQPQFEMAGGTDSDGMTKNLFLRRFRFMVGGTLHKYFEYFFQVDYPNLFKLDLSDTMATDKNAPGLNIQDAFVTVKALGELIKIDLEYRWLRHNFPRRIEEYVAEFPELDEDSAYEKLPFRQRRELHRLLGSARPFELMLGKILGGAATSLTMVGIYLAGGSRLRVRDEGDVARRTEVLGDREAEDGGGGIGKQL
jgi:hypothetical protein